MKLLTFIYIFLLLYSPKIGFFDLKFLLLPIGLYMTDLNLIRKKNISKAFFLSGLILFYSLMISMIYYFESTDFFRYIRSFISFLLIYLLFSSKRISHELLFKSFSKALLMHVFMILLMIIFPSIQSYINPIYGYFGNLRPIRYTGLTSGYDISGFVCLVSTFFFFNIYRLTNKTKYIILFLLSFVMVFFTSRTSMIYLLIICIYIGYSLSKNVFKSVKSFLILTSLLCIGVYGVIKIVIPVYQASVVTDRFSSGTFNNDESIIENNYSKSDPEKILKSFVVLPKNDIGVLFGTSKLPEPNSDSGYIRIINTVGLFGLFIILCFYFYIFFMSKKNKKMMFINNKSNYLKSMYSLCSITFLLTITASIKNNYFFTRTVFEIFVFSFIFIETYTKKLKKE